MTGLESNWQYSAREWTGIGKKHQARVAYNSKDAEKQVLAKDRVS
jgi:hypothetical protein